MTDSRVERGRDSEVYVAKYLRPLFPEAEAVGHSLPGRDVLNTDGFAIEVKARARFEPLKAMTQAERNSEPDEIPMVVLRMNGQGEKSIDDWLCMFRFKNARKLMEAYGRRESGTVGKRPESFSYRLGIGLGSRSNYSGDEVLKAAVHSILHDMGIESGNFEVEIRRR